ncbi:MAG: RimK/LysX family protein [Pseudomonadota bacterium]
MKPSLNKILVGRSEWCGLPELNIPLIKAKIDTGAKTSAIHAFDICSKVIDHKPYASFKVHPLQGDTHITITCEAPIIDERYIMSSNGHKEHRYIIMTSLKLGKHVYQIELSLSNRDPLTFRLLLGREALNKRMIVDPSVTCQQGKYKRAIVLQHYMNLKA